MKLSIIKEEADAILAENKMWTDAHRLALHICNLCELVKWVHEDITLPQQFTRHIRTVRWEHKVKEFGIEVDK